MLQNKRSFSNPVLSTQVPITWIKEIRTLQITPRMMKHQKKKLRAFLEKQVHVKISDFTVN